MALLDKIKNLLPGGANARPGLSSQTDKSVNKRVVMIGVLLVVSIIIMAVLFVAASWLSRPNAFYVKLIAEQQVVSQQIAVNAIEALRAGKGSFDELVTNRARFLNTLRIFESGDETLGISHLSGVFDEEHEKLHGIEEIFDGHVGNLVGSRESVENVKKQVNLINESIPKLVTLVRSIINEQLIAEAPSKNLILAGRQIALLNSVESSAHRVMTDGELIETAAEQLTSDIKNIDRNLTAMSKGSASLGVKRFIGGNVVGELTKFARIYRDVRKNVDKVISSVTELIKAQEAVVGIKSVSPQVLALADDLSRKIEAEDEKLQLLSLAGYGFGVISLALLITMVMMVVNESRARLAESQDQNERNQRAILRLLDEMTNLADGDLSTHTTVTEDITGAIADSVNYSIDALRDLVGTINKTSVQVSSAVQRSQGATGQLAEASNSQTREITRASETITAISQSMSNVSEKAADSAEVARKSVSIAHKGGETVRQTIAGMETIREQIQETSKRIKRLGESSQEIGDIVNLITEISDQTNILALNAAIQASMAGEAGRGFAVVADEVQRLAERTGDATKQIEALVKTIQADTNEASVSMEQSTANVVKGAKLTENAGGALDRIEQVSMNLAQRILEISDATKMQADESVKITRTMDAIQNVTQKTADGTTQASKSIGELTHMVQAMQNSVAGFKLPGV